LILVVLALGRRHGVLYKVPDDAYPVVGEALIWALDMGLGEAFTADTRATWIKLYGLLSATMRLASSSLATARTKARLGGLWEREGFGHGASLLDHGSR
jgi:hemoglobin-like flavoprotein